MSALAGRRVVVIGASSGVGRGFAERALADGARVVAAARRADALAEVCASDTALAVAADLTDAESAEAIHAAAHGFLGEIDLLLITAARSTLRRVAEVDETDWAAALQTNLIGVHRVIVGLLPLLAAGGLVAVLSSESVGEGRSGVAAYSASKAALEQLVLSFRMEHPAVRFSTVVIGATFPTDFANDFDMGLLTELMQEWTTRGQLAAELMDTADVVHTLAAVTAALLDAPTVGMERIVLRSPSLPGG